MQISSVAEVSIILIHTQDNSMHTHINAIPAFKRGLEFTLQIKILQNKQLRINFDNT